MAVVAALLGGAATLATWRTGAAPNGPTPAWFLSHPRQPDTLFDAWRHLSDRESALFYGSCQTLLGGVLRDAKGRPLAHTPVQVAALGRRLYSKTVVSDAAGRFLFYGWPLDDLKLASGLRNPNQRGGWRLYAYPGDPFTPEWRDYASQWPQGRPCEVKEAFRAPDRVFYVCTVREETKGTPGGSGTARDSGFRRFQQERRRALAAWRRANPSAPVRFGLPPRKHPSGVGTSGNAVQIVGADGVGVPGVLVRYAGGLAYGARTTNGAGRCVIPPFARRHLPLERRYPNEGVLSIEAPGYGVGSVPFAPTPGKTTVIRLEPPAGVAGRITDHKGNPAHVLLTINYQRPANLGFAVHVPVLPDGTFAFDRIWPGEPFRLRSVGHGSHGSNPVGPVQTPWMTLRPGERQRDIRFVLAPPSAVAGMVVDEQNAPVTTVTSASIEMEAGGGRASGGGGLGSAFPVWGKERSVCPFGRPALRRTAPRRCTLRRASCALCPSCCAAAPPDPVRSNHVPSRLLDASCLKPRRRTSPCNCSRLTASEGRGDCAPTSSAP